MHLLPYIEHIQVYKRIPVISTPGETSFAAEFGTLIGHKTAISTYYCPSETGPQVRNQLPFFEWAVGPIDGGSARFISETINMITFSALGTKQGGEVFDAF